MLFWPTIFQVCDIKVKEAISTEYLTNIQTELQYVYTALTLQELNEGVQQRLVFEHT
jgi:hypothetical protein